jgi:hypothetical protein
MSFSFLLYIKEPPEGGRKAGKNKKVKVECYKLLTYI